MLNKDYKEMLQILLDNEVKFLIVGAYAMGVHGYPRATGDIDIWAEASRENSGKVYKTLIKFNLRGFKCTPKGKHRRKTQSSFDNKIYNNRWQIESVFSRNKRLLGLALRSRTEVSRERECLLRVLTHNLMIIMRAA